jgi:hypothetical protein
MDKVGCSVRGPPTRPECAGVRHERRRRHRPVPPGSRHRSSGARRRSLPGRRERNALRETSYREVGPQGRSGRLLGTTGTPRCDERAVGGYRSRRRPGRQGRRGRAGTARHDWPRPPKPPCLGQFCFQLAHRRRQGRTRLPPRSWAWPCSAAGFSPRQCRWPTLAQSGNPVLSRERSAQGQTGAVMLGGLALASGPLVSRASASTDK